MTDAQTGAKPKKILLVEDDQMLREMYQTKFKSDGYEVETAANGADGLSLTKSGLPDIVMLDIILPMLDGFAVLEKVKADETTKNIPVVLLTNLGTDEDRAKGEKLGAVDYLVKANMTPEQVSKTIKKYL
jgi:DNA-binding response OmpR family regulator